MVFVSNSRKRKASNVYKSRRKGGYSRGNALRYARKYDPTFSVQRGEARIKRDLARKQAFNRSTGPIPSKPPDRTKRKIVESKYKNVRLMPRFNKKNIEAASMAKRMSFSNLPLKAIKRDGRIIGYEDELNKQSVAFPQGSTISQEDFDRINKVTAVRSKNTIKKIVKKYKVPANEVRAIAKKKGLEGLRQYIMKQSGINIQRRQTAKNTGEKLLRGIVVSAGLGAARGLIGVAETLKNPLVTLKNQIAALKTPVKTIRSMGHEFRLDPVGLVAEYYVFGKSLGLLGKQIKRSPVGRYVQEELYIRSQPIEIRPYVRAIIKSAKVQEKLNPKKISSLKSVDFMEVKQLTPIEAKALAKTLKETDSIVFGSAASRTLSAKKTPIPKDIDLATKNVATFNKKFLNNLPRKLRKDYIITKEKIRHKPSWRALMDVKTLDRLMPDRSIFTKRGFLPVQGYIDVAKAPEGSIIPRLSKKAGIANLQIPTQKLIDVKGIKLVGMGDQTTRKALGTLEVLIKKNYRRAKDPQSFLAGLQVQIEALRKSKPKTALGRLNKRRKIKTLLNALRLLASKDFVRLLNKQVPGLSKEYPLLLKTDKTKLKKAKRLPKSKVLKRLRAKKGLPKPAKTKTKEVKGKIKEYSVSELSKLPKSKFSKIPVSKIPKSKLSRLPISKLKGLPTSKLSKLPESILSKIPVSKIPKSKLSRLPISKLKGLPTSKLSKLPASKLSKLPKIKINPIPPSKRKRLKRDEKKKVIKKYIAKAKKENKFLFLPDLESIILGRDATPQERKSLLRTGRVFSGAERRKLVK